MSNQSIAVYEKPVPHLGMEDWFSRVVKLQSSADVRRDDSTELRYSSRTLRNETEIQTKWDTYHNNSKLSDRIAELDRWHITMEECMSRVKREMNLLRDEKSNTEKKLEALQLPLNVVSECMTIRDERLYNELTFDDVETQLKKELSIIESNQKMLSEQCRAAWEKLNDLNSIKAKLEIEIENKKEAKTIETAQLTTDKFCSNISYKVEPLKVPRHSFTYAGWLEYSKNFKKLIESELQDSYSMRESLYVCCEKTKNEIKAQQDRTEIAMRKRIFETQRLKNEMEWQKLKTNEEIKRCIEEIQIIENEHFDKIDDLKLAETRLENRKQRSGMELCCDEVYTGLCDEVLNIRKTQQGLKNKIDSLKTNCNALVQQEHLITLNLEHKQHTLMTDVKAFDVRKKLNVGKMKEPISQTDRNIVLTKMVNEIAPK